MQRTIDAAFAFGLTRIELTVSEGNANAIALYKSLGFEIEGLHRNASASRDNTKIYTRWPC